MQPKLLLVEDDANLARGLSRALGLAGYSVTTASGAKAAQKAAVGSAWDIILLDINLPDGSGFDVIQQIKQQGDTPVVFITARDLSGDEVHGFELGADDYITKPFQMEVLLKRLEAVLRRARRGAGRQVYDDGFLTIDFDACTGFAGGRELQFTPTEYKLLGQLIQNAGRVLTRNMLLANIWDVDENFVDEHALTVNINRLRKKIETQGHAYIKTVYGMGYLWTGAGL